MIITVPDTNATGIHMALVKARHNIGVASSMVFTMIVVADLRHYDAALEAAAIAWTAPGKLAGDVDNVVYFESSWRSVYRVFKLCVIRITVNVCVLYFWHKY